MALIGVTSLGTPASRLPCSLTRGNTPQCVSALRRTQVEARSNVRCRVAQLDRVADTNIKYDQFVENDEPVPDLACELAKVLIMFGVVPEENAERMVDQMQQAGLEIEVEDIIDWATCLLNYGIDFQRVLDLHESPVWLKVSPQHLDAKLKFLHKDLGLSQQQVAAIFECHHNAIYLFLGAELEDMHRTRVLLNRKLGLSEDVLKNMVLQQLQIICLPATRLKAVSQAILNSSKRHFGWDAQQVSSAVQRCPALLSLQPTEIKFNIAAWAAHSKNSGLQVADMLLQSPSLLLQQWTVAALLSQQYIPRA